MKSVSSVSLRVLSLPDYRVPLYAHVLDSDNNINESNLELLTQQIARSSRTQIITTDKWDRLSSIAADILGDERLWSKLSPQNPSVRKELHSTWDVYRKKLIRQLKFTRSVPSKLAYEAISNSLYQSSEGIMLPLDYTISPSSLTWFNETLSAQIIMYIETNRKRKPMCKYLERDDVVAWLRLLFLVQNNPTQRFKKQFSNLLTYEVSFGLSPKSRSETLEALIKNSKAIALVPLLTGINTISSALTTGEWLVALKAATTTGAVVIVLISTIAVTDRIIDWVNSKK